MKTRNLFVYLLAFLVTFAFAVTVVGQVDPPDTDPTTITVSSVTTEAGSVFTVTAYLEDDAGNPLEGYDINFAFGKDTDDDNVLEEVIDSGGIVSTDASGYAEYVFTAPEVAGTDYDYRAYFDGTENYDYSAKTAQVTVNKIPTVLQVRTGNPLENKLRSFRVEGYYSLPAIKQIYRIRRKSESCVFIHTPQEFGGGFS